jgi:3-hydroxyacyl-CoA dehydrogenase
MTGDEVKTVAVVGAGTMGPGMAATFARHGFDVRLTDVKEEILGKAKGMVDVVYNALIGGGFITAADADQGRANISYTLDLAGAVDGADFVLEAVPAKLEIKHSFFANVEKLVRDDTILASQAVGLGQFGAKTHDSGSEFKVVRIRAAQWRADIRSRRSVVLERAARERGQL